MQQAQKAKITLRMAGREYPLWILPDHEANIRSVGKQINEKLDQMKANSGISDIQDLLTMVLYDSLMTASANADTLDTFKQVIQKQIENAQDVADATIAIYSQQ